MAASLPVMAPRGPEHLSSMASRVADVVITSYKGCAECDAAPPFYSSMSPAAGRMLYHQKAGMTRSTSPSHDS